MRRIAAKAFSSPALLGMPYAAPAQDNTWRHGIVACSATPFKYGPRLQAFRHSANPGRAPRAAKAPASAAEGTFDTLNIRYRPNATGGGRPLSHSSFKRLWSARPDEPLRPVWAELAESRGHFPPIFSSVTYRLIPKAALERRPAGDARGRRLVSGGLGRPAMSRRRPIITYIVAKAEVSGGA